jgi:outer membrane protein assembly factor BamB
LSAALSLCFIVVSIGTVSALSPEEFAAEVYEKTGVKGGLVVHVGCGDGELVNALRINDRYTVQGLASNAETVAGVRAKLMRQAVHGPVTVDSFDEASLPYVDNSVNLLIGDRLGGVTMDEVMRVLAPNGVAYIKESQQWRMHRKPIPAALDEWTHFLYDASNNAVSNDTAVDQPNHLQWIGEPESARSHDHLASMSVAVSAGGRIFYIADEGSLAVAAFPAKWSLTARDAYNGVQLWKKPIGPWEGHLRGFRSGPPELHRRLVAVGDRVYVTLGYGKPVTVLDAATGEVIREYGKTQDTLEILYHQGILYLVLGDIDKIETMKRRGSLPPRQKSIMAVDAKSGTVLWHKTNEDTDEVMPLTLTVKEGRLYFQNPDNVLCWDTQDGSEIWKTARPLSKLRRSWSTPTMVVYDDVLLSADMEGPKADEERPEQIEWDPSSRGGVAPQGEMIAYCAKTGEELWRCKARENYNAPPDVLVVDGLVWAGDLVRARDAGITEALDIHTGDVKKQRPRDDEFYTFGFGHHRCYRNKATTNYLLLGRSGVELLDVQTGNVPIWDNAQQRAFVCTPALLRVFH